MFKQCLFSILHTKGAGRWTTNNSYAKKRLIGCYTEIIIVCQSYRTLLTFHRNLSPSNCHCLCHHSNRLAPHFLLDHVTVAVAGRAEVHTVGHGLALFRLIGVSACDQELLAKARVQSALDGTHWADGVARQNALKIVLSYNEMMGNASDCPKSANDEKCLTFSKVSCHAVWGHGVSTAL